jgi:hypothetical protein
MELTPFSLSQLLNWLGENLVGFMFGMLLMFVTSRRSRKNELEKLKIQHKHDLDMYRRKQSDDKARQGFDEIRRYVNRE